MIRILVLYVLVVGFGGGAYLVGRLSKTRAERTEEALDRVNRQHVEEVERLERKVRYWSTLSDRVDGRVPRPKRRQPPTDEDVTD